MSDSDSSLELHDVNFVESDGFFDYDDPFSLSPQLTAVIHNDVKRLRNLLKFGKSSNICDNYGNTPLHVAILKDKQKSFDYLLTVKDIRIDATNYDGITPLLMALKCTHKYYAMRLIEKGANVTLKQNSGHTSLHYAVGNGTEVAQNLIEKGANINEINCYDETPLYLACSRNDPDLVHLLLFYGADPSIPNYEENLPFDISLTRCPPDIQEILFDYTFDKDKVEVKLNTFIHAMVAGSPLLYKIIEKTSDIIYCETDLLHLEDNLPVIKPKIFRHFIDNFGDVARDFFQFGYPISDFVEYVAVSDIAETDIMEFFFTLCGSPYIEDVVEKHNPQVGIVNSIITKNLSQENLTKILCCVLSYGIDIIPEDLNMVYKYYGFGELFRILLHMRIVNYGSVKTESLEVFFMPYLIHNVDLNFDSFYKMPRDKIIDSCYLLVKKFFAISEYERRVPSLLECSRNAARKYLVEKYAIKNNVQFFTMLKWLPIAKIYKAILSYEKEIY